MLTSEERAKAGGGNRLKGRHLSGTLRATQCCDPDTRGELADGASASMKRLRGSSDGAVVPDTGTRGCTFAVEVKHEGPKWARVSMRWGRGCLTAEGRERCVDGQGTAEGSGEARRKVDQPACSRD